MPAPSTPSRLWLLDDQTLRRREPNMMIRADYHPSFQQIAFLTEETGEYSKRRLNHSDGAAETFYRDLKLRGERSLQAASSSSTTSTRVTARRPGTTSSTMLSPFAGGFWSRLAIANVHSGHDAQLAASHSCCHSAAEMKYFGEGFLLEHQLSLAPPESLRQTNTTFISHMSSIRPNAPVTG